MRRGMIQPSMRQPPPPGIALVIDTSGSIDDKMLARLISETESIIKVVNPGGKRLAVVSCDAASTGTQAVRRLDQIRLSGGGGTDMRVGIDTAMQAVPAPKIIIVGTDGYTPWPDDPIPGVVMIALVVSHSQTSAPPETPWFMTRIEVCDD